jgi:hypothetical protein
MGNPIPAFVPMPGSFDGAANLDPFEPLIINGLRVEFTSGALLGEDSFLTNYTGAPDRRLTVNPSFSQAPAVGDSFNIELSEADLFDVIGTGGTVFDPIGQNLAGLNLQFTSGSLAGQQGLIDVHSAGRIAGSESAFSFLTAFNEAPRAGDTFVIGTSSIPGFGGSTFRVEQTFDEELDIDGDGFLDGVPFIDAQGFRATVPLRIPPMAGEFDFEWDTTVPDGTFEPFFPVQILP